MFIISLVAIGYRPPQAAGEVATVATTSSERPTILDDPSVDQLVAINAAAGVAETTQLPVAANVANLSLSLAAKSSLSQSDDSIITKPQIIQPTADSRELKTYIAVAGDTTASIGDQFGISAQTVKWANDLSSDAVEADRTIIIPPVDGVVYTVKDGDSIASIADKYKVDQQRLIMFNDLEIDGLKNEQRLILPGGVLPETERPGYRAPVAPVPAPQSSQIASAPNSYTIKPSGGMGNASVGNRYAFGNCTWYAYERRAELGRPVGSFLGNANTWAMNTSNPVGRTPQVGAVLVDGAGYYGHVAIVEEVFSDGSIRISEMNYYGGGGGFNIVSGRTMSAGTAAQYQYIY